MTLRVLAFVAVLFTAASAHAGYLLVEGRRVEVPFHVVHSLCDFADVARWAALPDPTRTAAKPREGDAGPEDDEPRTGPWYRGSVDWTGYVRPRETCRGTPPEAQDEGDADALAAWRKAHCVPLDARKGVRLVVLHASRTNDAASLVVRLAERGLSTHLAIDWDGTVYQLADLGLATFHASGFNDVSVGVHLVNPMQDLRGAPGGARDPVLARHGQERSVVTERIHGADVTSTGPTAAQVESLTALSRALVSVFPSVARRVPRDAAGRLLRTELASPSRASGFVGHFHLATARRDPGPGIDWEGLEEAIAPAH